MILAWNGVQLHSGSLEAGQGGRDWELLAPVDSQKGLLNQVTVAAFQSEIMQSPRSLSAHTASNLSGCHHRETKSLTCLPLLRVSI